MSNIIEISDLDIGGGSDLKSSNFGSGIELLMNDKAKDIGGDMKVSDIELNDLNDLENELNNLSDDVIGEHPTSDIFGGSSSEDYDIASNKVRFEDDTPTISLGEQTVHSVEEKNKTWDGYSTFNNVPLDPDRNLSQPKMSPEQMLREKFKYLRKLEDLEKKGIEISKKYNMDSNLQEMKGEYETIMEEKSKQNNIKFQGNMLMACINGIEFLNNKFDPFDVQLDGWGEQINENITDYDDVFAELYDKYSSKAKMAPELKLLFQLGGSAMMVHMTNTMFKSSMPGMDDIMRQNPDLMKSFQSAAVNSMSNSSPGFSGFMNNIMDSNQGPPSPMATQGHSAPPPPSSRPGNNNFSSSRSSNDGIHFQETTSRPEMKGPSDISDILSGLKTKSINIQQNERQESMSASKSSSKYDNADSSTISISDLKELQGAGTMPKKSKRRNKSASNTISLDI